MKMNILILLSIILYGSNCEKFVNHGYSIRIENHSADTIKFYGSYNYPDTTLSNEKPRLNMVYPSKYSRIDSREKWEDVLPNNIISIFILSKDTVDAYSWEKIRSEYNILKRYDLSISDLENQNWTITYP